MTPDEPQDKCPECLGAGFLFRIIDADHRAQIHCPFCEGTGKASVAMVLVLTLSPAERKRRAEEKSAAEAKIAERFKWWWH